MNTQCSSAVSLTGSKVNAAAFERFLYCLGPDPETAGQKYESIRARLITMFQARRCVFAEDLADATFERVARKLNELTTELNGDPVRYFYGVAKKVYLEYQHEIVTVHLRSECLLRTTTNDQASAGDPELENMLKQLDEALDTIPKSDRELILRYYTGNGPDKINHRRAMAEQCGGLNALRVRVFRIRREIKNYMYKTVKQLTVASQRTTTQRSRKGIYSDAAS